MNLGHLALLVILPLLQIPAVLYLSRYFEVEEDRPRTQEFEGSRPYTSTSAGDCRRCGATNDPTYTYCSHCLARLPV